MTSKPYNLPNSFASVALLVLCVLACCAVPAVECRAQSESDDSGEWLKQNPEGANAEFLMPVQPREMERSFKPVADRSQIVVKLKICSIDQGQIVFVFSYHDLHDMPEGRVKIREILDGAVKGTVARVIGQLNADEQVSLREYPGRKISYQFTQNGQGLKSESEIYLIGKRQYVLNTIFKDSNYDPELSEKFFDSFNPFNPEETLAMDGLDEPLDAQSLDAGSGFDIPQGKMPVELK